MADELCNFLEILRVTNADSLVQHIRALAEQMNMLRNKKQSFDQTKNAGNSNSQNRSSINSNGYNYQLKTERGDPGSEMC